ncbi:MAG TPA: single-stranded-DNA-specific exonuclease RecJ [Pyrinomonadaceae bacterium]|jgi:single-stranded-DNA-specific exonuclease|nr:single-stranded-DNA-specific exonuclease RecJ [Pyrinomonadaceae bacterium]
MKRWTIQKHDAGRVNELAGELKVTPLVAALLIARGYGDLADARKFLNPSLDQLHEPYLLKGMKEAIGRILLAIENKEKILIWGDYDVDGTTGTALLRSALGTLGAETGFHVPHRFTEGYGLNIPALEEAKNDGFSLVITVDCGARAFEPIAWAQANGMDVIVTDHHLSDGTHGNPVAFAVVNPNQAGCEYPDKNLAGVGVAFKVAHALLREKGRDDLVPDFLKVAAIGTIADMMKLTGENRAIVAIGLKDLQRTKNLGLRALMDVSDCHSEMTVYDIGFRIAPRINAAGRMDVAKVVVELLETQDFDEAHKMAEILNTRNRDRQLVQKEITELALLEYIEKGGSESQSHLVVVAGVGWHRGVIGLAASKISERVHRPSVVISLEEGIGHGSARSIKNYHLLDGLETCAELFEQFGGHAAAAGMKIKEENIQLLRERLNRHAMENLSEDDLIPEVRIDALLTPKSLNIDLVYQLKVLEPFGQGNPRPVFITRDLIVAEEPLIMKEKHLKLRLKDKSGKKFEAIWWNGVELADEKVLRPGQKVEIAYSPEINTWNGNQRLQLVVEDIRS